MTRVDVRAESNTTARIEMGEVYVICRDCGARLYSDDALPGETHDRDRPCPRMSGGVCEYDEVSHAR